MSKSQEPSSFTQLPLRDEDRPRFTDEQLQSYFARIRLPQKYLDSPVLTNRAQAWSAEYGLPFLKALTRHHTCNVPFENLELHYSAHKKITLDPSDLFDKIVRQRRGGRCMENNTFFATVLRSIGFEVRNCAGRVSRAMSPYAEVRRTQSETYDGWNHMLNLVRLDGEWYVVDVGMGSMGPNLPYPLKDGFETVSIAPRRIRLQYRAIPESYGNSSNELWCYDACYKPSENSEENTWTPVYCFTTTEFLPQDYEMMSWYTSTYPRSFFTRHVTSTRMLMDEEREEIVGNVTLFEAGIKRSIGGKSESLIDCKTEDERVGALKDYFEIELSEEQRNGIPPELRLG